MVHPQLTDMSLCQGQNKVLHGLPAVFFLHVGRTQGHYVVEDDKINSSDAFHEAVQPPMPFFSIQWRHTFEIFFAEYANISAGGRSIDAKPVAGEQYALTDE